MTPKHKLAHEKLMRDLRVMRSRIQAFAASGGSLAGLDALVEECLDDLRPDLGLDEWSKDDHPHAIHARAHAVGALHLALQKQVT